MYIRWIEISEIKTKLNRHQKVRKLLRLAFETWAAARESVTLDLNVQLSKTLLLYQKENCVIYLSPQLTFSVL